MISPMRQLRYFVAAAETGPIFLSSEQSACLAVRNHNCRDAVEERLGVKLFERMP